MGAYPHRWEINEASLAFEAPPEVGRARRVLLKPHAPLASPYPLTTSRELLGAIIDGIRRISEADIILLEGPHSGESVHTIYQSLGYNFPRVQALDVRECVWVEVENPLTRPFALSSFWIPNVLLSCDYLISVAPFRVVGRRGVFSMENLLGVLPFQKYRGAHSDGLEFLFGLGLPNVLADLYFTVPFDLGIVDARQKVVERNETEIEQVEEFGKIFIGDPVDADRQAAAAAGIEVGYARLVDSVKLEQANGLTSPLQRR